MDQKLKRWMRAEYLNYTRWVIPTLSFFTVVHYIEFWGPSDGGNLRNFRNFLLTDSNGVHIFFYLLKNRCLHEFPKWVVWLKRKSKMKALGHVWQPSLRDMCHFIPSDTTLPILFGNYLYLSKKKKKKNFRARFANRVISLVPRYVNT